MPSNARPRKQYRPRAINAPITAGLAGEFADCFLIVETGLHLRAPTTAHFDALAMLLNTIGPVAIRRFGESSADALAIAAAADAMNAAADRAATAGGTAPLTDHELATISRGIDAARAAIPYLDIRSLAAQHRVVLSRQRASTAGADAWQP